MSTNFSQRGVCLSSSPLVSAARPAGRPAFCPVFTLCRPGTQGVRPSVQSSPNTRTSLLFLPRGHTAALLSSRPPLPPSSRLLEPKPPSSSSSAQHSTAASLPKVRFV